MRVKSDFVPQGSRCLKVVFDAAKAASKTAKKALASLLDSAVWWADQAMRPRACGLEGRMPRMICEFR